MSYKNCEDYIKNTGKCRTAVNDLNRFEQIISLYEEDEISDARIDFNYLLACDKGYIICCCECKEREGCEQQCVEYDCEEI